MTLAELRAAHPTLFYEQSWFTGEAFMDREPSGDWERFMPVDTDGPRPPVTAADMAALYVEHPHETIWRRFLWTDDADRWGNRVYVGGVGEYGIEMFQIHRHLTPRAWFVAVPE